jgi:CRP-like cAMP-binding protein
VSKAGAEKIEIPQLMSVAKYFFNYRPVLESLPGSDLKMFKEHLRLQKIRKGTELFHEGNYPTGVYILKRGKVKIYQNSPDGGEQIIYIYGPGEMFGYRPLLCGEHHPASAMTIEECGIYFLSARNFFSVLKGSAALSNILLKNLSFEFTVLVNRIAAFSQRSAKERLALSLLILQERYRKQGVAHPEIQLSRSDLAAFVGTTVETVARLLTKLKGEKIIRVNGRRIVVLHNDRLVRLME